MPPKGKSVAKAAAAPPKEGGGDESPKAASETPKAAEPKASKVKEPKESKEAKEGKEVKEVKEEKKEAAPKEAAGGASPKAKAKGKAKAKAKDGAKAKGKEGEGDPSGTAAPPGEEHGGAPEEEEEEGGLIIYEADEPVHDPEHAHPEHTGHHASGDHHHHHDDRSSAATSAEMHGQASRHTAESGKAGSGEHHAHIGSVQASPADHHVHTGPVQIDLHLYDADISNDVSGRKALGTGAFHTGIRIDELEWSFGYSEKESGVFSSEPWKVAGHKFRLQLVIGQSKLCRAEVDDLIKKLGNVWHGHGYDFLRRNSCHFCDTLCRSLGIGGLPQWIMHLAASGRTLHDEPNAEVTLDAILKAAHAGEFHQNYGDSGRETAKAKDLVKKGKVTDKRYLAMLDEATNSPVASRPTTWFGRMKSIGGTKSKTLVPPPDTLDRRDSQASNVSNKSESFNVHGDDKFKAPSSKAETQKMLQKAHTGHLE